MKQTLALRRGWARGLALVLLLGPVGGCAALYTTITRSELELSTRMSDTIFLEPVSPSRRSIFLDIKNTTAVKDLDLAAALHGKIAEKGYTVVREPDQATYHLQVQTLYIGEANLTAAEAVFEEGAGAPLVEGAIAAGIGVAAGLESPEATGVGVVVGAASALLGWMVRDVTFTVISDIRVSERTDQGFSVREEQFLRQGARGSARARSNYRDNRRRYEARVMSTARKANLELKEALPSLREDLAESIAGIF